MVFCFISISFTPWQTMCALSGGLLCATVSGSSMCYQVVFTLHLTELSTLFFMRIWRFLFSLAKIFKVASVASSLFQQPKRNLCCMSADQSRLSS